MTGCDDAPVRRRAAVAAVAAALAAQPTLPVLLPTPQARAEAAADEATESRITVETSRVAVAPEPSGQDVDLDVAVYRTTGGPERRPAVVLAHGFGGSRLDLDDQARRLAREGYVAVAYTARGFGASGGAVHLDAPAFEVADARALLDLLAARPDVQLDAPGDPRVGVTGASYGGALALLLAGTDPRVDALVPIATWNDLVSALAPSSLAPEGPVRDPGTPAAERPQEQPGVLKTAWLTALAAGGAGASPAVTGDAQPGDATTADACGRLDPTLCAAYAQAVLTGEVGPDLAALLRASSPATVLDDVRAPTLLVQGESDSLFPLPQADATARALAAHGVPVRVRWIAGGHDGGLSAADPATGMAATEDAVLAWFDGVLRGDGPPPTSVVPGFSYAVPQPASAADVAAAVAAGSAPGAAPAGAAPEPDDDEDLPEVRALPDYPGLGPAEGAEDGAVTGAVERREVTLSGDTQQVLSPPRGTPSALTQLPGGGAVTTGLGATGLAAALAVLPGQSAVFDSAPLEEGVTGVGAPTVRLQVTSTTTDATLFASVLDVSPTGAAVLPQQLVAPVRLTGLTPGEPREVDVALPAVVHRYAAGHLLRVAVSSTDQAYAVPQDPRLYRVGLANATVAVPVAPQSEVDDTVTSGRSGTDVPWGLLLALALVVLAAALLRPAGRLLGRRRGGEAGPPAGDAADGGEPLVVEGLSLVYRSGLRAVDDVSFAVGRGQVVGLLGPNGAGKTSTLRMVLGLVHPTSGHVRVLGHAVVPGAPVLSRVGAFVEGPGLLPHLSGLANLRLAWEATGRPAEDARIEEVLAIAGLGDAVSRPVRSYSQGMRARIAIAQAMLGMPELLVLDEPTNGLDPPQIHTLREVLRSYAAGGRAVLVSSHLLAEVEQTCSHVVIMQRGRVVVSGSVAELVAGGDGALLVEVAAAPQVAAALAAVVGLAGAEAERTGDTEITVTGAPVPAVVAALVHAGVDVERVEPRRRLEEVFLEVTGS